MTQESVRLVFGRPVASLAEPGKSGEGASWRRGSSGELCFTRVRVQGVSGASKWTVEREMEGVSS